MDENINDKGCQCVRIPPPPQGGNDPAGRILCDWRGTGRMILSTEVSGDLQPEARASRTENNRTQETPSGYLTLKSPSPVLKMGP